MSSVKKAGMKFTIQFRQNDPTHQYVADLLNRQGRRKAKYIVDCISFYEQSNGRPVPQMDMQTIEVVVRRLFKEYSNQISRAAPVADKPKISEHKTEESPFSNAPDELDSESIGCIAAAIDSFMKR